MASRSLFRYFATSHKRLLTMQRMSSELSSSSSFNRGLMTVSYGKLVAKSRLPLTSNDNWFPCRQMGKVMSSSASTLASRGKNCMK